MTKTEELTDYITKSVFRQYVASDKNIKNFNSYLSRNISRILHDLGNIVGTDIRHAKYNEDDDVYVFAINHYRKNWRQLTINSKQVDGANLLAPILFEVLLVGHTKVASAVRLRERTMDALMEYEINRCMDDSIIAEQRFDFTGVDTFATPINMKSIRAFVNNLSADADETELKKIKLIAKAHSILTSVQTTNDNKDEYVLLQEMTLADSGRLYFRGVNLQNCPKKLRHAALGHCHSYDMRAGVFGVMAGIANAYCQKQLNKDTRFERIEEYLLNKEKIRRDITEYLWPNSTVGVKDGLLKKFHGFQKVKTALTAIGFGAKRTGNASWKDVKGNWKSTSLRDTFKSKEHVEKFLQMPVVSKLIDEFEEINRIVLLRLQEDAEFASKFELDGLKDSQKLAMMYQGTEAMILSELLNYISDYEVLLPAHDGVYVRKRFDLASVQSMMTLPFGIEQRYVQFDHEQIGLATPAGYDAAHKQRIAEDEALAKSYRPSTAYGIDMPYTAPKQQVMTPWGPIDAELVAAEDKVKPKAR